MYEYNFVTSLTLTMFPIHSKGKRKIYLLGNNVTTNYRILKFKL